MKKTILLSLLLILTCNKLFATVWTVNNSFSPQTAVNAAAAGDTVYITDSSTPYPWFTSNKKLVFIGNGCKSMAQITSGIPSARLPHIILDPGADSCIFQGLNIEYLGGMRSWLIVRECYQTGAIEINSNAHIYCNVIENAQIAIYYSASDNLIHNNIFNNGSGGGTIINMSNFGTGYNNIVKNNLFISINGSLQAAAFGQFNNSLIENNIFYRCCPKSTLNPNVNVTNCVFNNNLTFETNQNSIPFGNNTGVANLIGINPKFITFQTWTSPFDFSLDYHLKVTSPGHLYGTDGTDIGPYGGNNFCLTLNIGVVPPTNLSITNITSTSAKCNWYSVAGATNYTVRYRIKGTSSWTMVDTSATNKMLTNLSTNTQYQWSVRSYVSGKWSAWYMPNKNFKTKATPRFGLDENDEQSISIYPNPNNGNFKIDFGTSFHGEKHSIIVRNILSQTVFQTETSQQQVEINLNNQIDKGIYFLEIKNQNHEIISTRKIIIQ